MVCARVIQAIALAAAALTWQRAAAQEVAPIAQAQGEQIISRLAEDIPRKYPSDRRLPFLKIFYFKSASGEIVLMRGTDLFIAKQDGGPAILELQETALAAGMRFAGTDDPLSSLANFPGHPRYRRHLVSLLDSPNAAVRAGALLALSRMPHASLVLPIAKRLKDENLDVRLAAVFAFGSEERHVLGAFMLESPQNMAMARQSVSEKRPLALPHPYRTSTVKTILTDYLNSPVRVADMPAILNTLVTLRMKGPVASKVRIHSHDPTVESFFQQCYRKLDSLP